MYNYWFSWNAQFWRIFINGHFFIVNPFVLTLQLYKQFNRSRQIRVLYRHTTIVNISDSLYQHPSVFIPLCVGFASALDHWSLPPEFESRRSHIWGVFHLWLRLVTFRGRSAHLAYHVHKSGLRTSIITIIIIIICVGRF